ncbi:DDE_3 domain-containing protein [Trichonephila clavipes]|nr:DDE_3 domain-containing protein [Trichonephila clavipes]
METLFPTGDGIIQDDNAPSHTASLVQSWFDEHEDELKHLPWPSNLDRIEMLGFISVHSIGNRYPPPASLPERSQSLHKEEYSILLNTIQHLRESIPGRI